GFTVVTEGLHDVALLQAILNISSEDPKIKFVAAGGWSSADSLARSYLVSGGTKVVLVVDADSSDTNQVEARRNFLKGSLGEIASPTMWTVVVIAPEIEALLFQDRKVIEAIAGRPVSDTEFVTGSFEPKRVLQQLLRGKPLTEVYTRMLKDLDLTRIMEASPIRELQSMIKGSEIKNGSRRKKDVQQSTAKPGLLRA
ncbi:MAG: hypothetical protein M3Y56_04455, partial [Armatimonadota bacterium]|nr:hypothetical protein [Armatimonadota bacterium]